MASMHKAIVEPDEVKRASLVWQMWKIHMDEGPFFIGTVANYPRIIIKSKKLINVPNQRSAQAGRLRQPLDHPVPGRHQHRNLVLQIKRTSE